MTMNILTRQQKRVLNGIKYFSAEYQGGVPYNILKLDLDTSEEDLNPILEHLENENYISRRDGMILLENRESNGNKEKGVDVPEETQLNESPKETVEANIPDLPTDDTEDVNDINSSVDTGDVNDTSSAADAEDVNDADAGDVGDTGETGEVEPKEEFSEVELKSLEIIENLVDDSGNLSRTLLEGNLLYGELELSSILMYNLITSLEYRGILKKFKLTDGEYYKFTP
ncbi:hypothetical protein [Methanobacterium sp.]|uniref:hypothetical protein n=1 Tax=Methanobacterium sp. TaxID=2164 RepID=UPI002ABBBAD1|nr:hypothetical protein [Methanobacterium sp.]MDY9923574.1 hypothetical protein [Methanobacterium sp.]